MTPLGINRVTAIAIGSFQVLANAASLVRGLAKLPQELANEHATARIADLLKVSWVYGTLGNLCVSALLLVVSSGLRTADPVARHVAMAIGLYYLVLGPAAYVFGERRHVAMLVFSVLGGALLASLWSAR